MPYISTEEVREIRKNIRKELPEFKVSVTKDHHSSVCVSLMEGPVDFKGDHIQVNHYWYKDHYKDQPEVVEIFSKILDTIYKCKNQKTLVVDGDYGAVPNYYIDINVGKWDKPYKKLDK